MATEHDILEAIRARHPKPEWAFLPHVRNQTGFSRTVRTCDALVMNLYPSRGMEVHGFEVKVSRADWQKELKDPGKAEEICRFCDRWWVAVDDAAIVRPGELPATWGLMAIKGGKLKVVTEAPKLAPQPVDRSFLGSLLRSAQECLTDDAAVAARVAAAVEAERQRSAKHEERVVKGLTEQTERLQARLMKLSQTTGLDLRQDYKIEEAAAAIRFVKEGGMERQRVQLEQMADNAERMAAFIRETMKARPVIEGVGLVSAEAS